MSEQECTNNTEHTHTHRFCLTLLWELGGIKHKVVKANRPAAVHIHSADSNVVGLELGHKLENLGLAGAVIRKPHPMRVSPWRIWSRWTITK